MNMFNFIGKVLVSSIRNLFNNQPDVLTPTPFTGMTEWNFGHHLANEIAKYIFWLDHDLDVIKHNYQNRRPDIIFHERGISDLNFLVVEIKTNASSDEDIKKIKNDWMGNPLCYRFGASVWVRSVNDFEVTVLHGSRKEKFSKMEEVIPIPCEPGFGRKVIDLTNKIVTIAKNNGYLRNPAKKAKVREYEKQIDQMIYKLYGLTPEEVRIVEGS